MDFKESNKKHYLENLERKKAYDLKQTKLAEATSDAQRRAINLEIPQSEIDWLNRNHVGLETPYRTWVDNVSTQLDKAAKFMSMKFGIKIDKGHPISGAGDKANPYEKTGKLTPTTSYDSAGANDVGMSELHASNVRHGNKNLLKRTDLDELGVNSNWHWSSTNFAAERPDIRDATDRAKLGLNPLSPKPSHLGLNLLAVGDIDVDDLQAKMWLEHEYKNAGIDLTPDQQADLGKFFQDQRNKELIINAEKHSWKRHGQDKILRNGDVVWRRGDLVLDENRQPIRQDNWNLKTKSKYDPSNDRFQQRDEMAKRGGGKTNRSTHLIPNGENGENGTNGKKLNGKNNGKLSNGKKLAIGGAITGALTNFMPTPSAAKEIYPMIQSGNYGDAAKTYGKDLVVGQSTSRAMGSAVKMLQSKFGKNISKALARKALQIAGRQLVKKGAALAAGPAAPIVMTSLLIKDAHDVANALTGGALEPGKPTSTNRKRLRHGRK